MKDFIDKLISRLEERKKEWTARGIEFSFAGGTTVIDERAFGMSCGLYEAIEIVNQLAEEYKGGWISVKDRLPEYENKDGSWVRCIVKVMRSHYPTSTYDDCDSPYDETLVMCAMYDVKQKIWHLDCDEQLNALIDIDDSPMNGDYVIEWMSVKSLSERR